MEPIKVLYSLILLLSLHGSLNPRPIDSQTESKPEWKYLVTSEDHNQVWKTYYDVKNIKRKSEGTIEVWLKQVPITKTEEERQRIIRSIIKNRELNEMPIKGYGKFAYSLTLIEFDCSKKVGRRVSIKDYNEAGELLGTDTIEGVPFAPVPEGSMAGVVLEAVCK